MNTPRELALEYPTDWGFWSNESASSIGGVIGNVLKGSEKPEKCQSSQWSSQVLNSLCATQEPEWKKIEEYIDEEARYLDDSKASYQNLTDDLQRSEIVTKNAEGVIASAQTAITKAQALIYDNEQKLANKKKKLKEVEAVKS